MFYSFAVKATSPERGPVTFVFSILCYVWLYYMVKNGSRAYDILYKMEYRDDDFNYPIIYICLVGTWLGATLQFCCATTPRFCRKSIRRNKFLRHIPLSKVCCFRCEKMAGEQYITMCFKEQEGEGYDSNVSHSSRIATLKWLLFIGMGIANLVPFAGFMADEDEWPFTWKYPKYIYEACVAAFVPHLFWVLSPLASSLAYGIVYGLVSLLIWILNVKSWCPRECFETCSSDGSVRKIETIKASTYTPVTVTRPVVRPTPVVKPKPFVRKPVVVPKPAPATTNVVNNTNTTNVVNNNQTTNNVNNVTNNVTNVVNNTTVINQVQLGPPMPAPAPSAFQAAPPQNQVGYLDKDGNGIAECGLCMGEFNNEELVNRLSCNQFHIFHIKCMSIYLEKSGSYPYCPLCHEVIERGSVKKAVYIIDHQNNRKSFFAKTGSNYGFDPQNINPADYQQAPQHIPEGDQTKKGLVEP